MIPRALDDIFKISNSEETTVSVSFIEIYNEKVYDILSDNPTLQIYNKGQRYTGATKKVIVNNDANSVLKQGLACLIYDFYFFRHFQFFFFIPIPFAQEIKIGMCVQQR